MQDTIVYMQIAKYIHHLYAHQLSVSVWYNTYQGGDVESPGVW